MDDMNDVRRFARRLRIGTVALAAALAVVMLAIVLLPAQPGLTIRTDGLPRGWGSAAACIVAALVVWALVELARMLREVERGETFATPVTRRFRRFAGLLLVAAIVRIALPPLVGLGLALGAGGGATISLGIDERDAILLLLGGVLLLVARLFDEAARLAEDNESIV